jgi:hypothetical protein
VKRLSNEAVLAVAAGASAVIALSALGVSIYAENRASNVHEDQDKIAKSQLKLQRQVEERQSAPSLDPGVEPRINTQGPRKIALNTPYGVLHKRPSDLYFTEDRIVIPVYNIGAGVAAVQGGPGFLDTCTEDTVDRTTDPGSVKPSMIRRTGYYNVPPGTSLQLRFEAQDRLQEFREASREKRLNLILFYTDHPLGRRLRWSCFEYLRFSRRGPWGLGDHSSDVRPISGREVGPTYNDLIESRSAQAPVVHEPPPPRPGR